MFCQLQELTKSKSTRPSSIKAALLALPATLDETYERMLLNIAAEDQPYALTLLRWLAYAQAPLTLDELAEASVIFPSEHAINDDLVGTDDLVATDDRGGWEDALDILAGLVVPIEASDQHVTDEGAMSNHPANLYNHDIRLPKNAIGKHTMIRLAHFSVKEYLESNRISRSTASSFQLDPSRDHRWITQCCLVYLVYYSSSVRKSSSKLDLVIFPPLNYAAAMWYRHALLQQ